MARTALSARGQLARVVVALPALVALFLLGQGILDRLALRLDLTPDRRYTLSDRLGQVLDGLPAEVRIVAFLRSQDPRNAYLRDLLGAMRLRSARVRVDVVDVNRNPALAREYGVGSYGGLAVESEGRRRALANPREEILIAALQQVTRRERRVIGWVMGHGEGDPFSAERHEGWSGARRALESEWYEVRPVSLAGGDVGAEVAVLVIAGPQKDLLPEERAALVRYLERSGPALVLLDPGRAPELVGLLRRYGVAVGDDVVIDPTGRLYGGEGVTMRLAIERRDHPVLGPLEVPPLFSLSRSVRHVPEAGRRMRAVGFLRTSPESWATDAPAARTGADTAFRAGVDRRGPVTVGLEAVYEVAGASGGAARQGRLMVFGNAEFASNFFIDYLGNADLLVNAVVWLAREEHAIGRRERARELAVEQFYVSAAEGARTFWVIGVLEPALFALVGAVVALRRRRS